MSTASLTRREWLVASGLGAAALSMPSLLEAAPVAPGTAPWSPGLLAQEAAATLARRRAGPVRLNYNENPFGMSPKAKAALMSAWEEHNKYDPPALGELRAAFAASAGVPADHVLVTQGSGEVLSVAALAYGMQGGEIVSGWPTFEGLPAYAEGIGATVHRVPLDPSLAHDLGAMDARVGARTRLVFVCNPNNPTGTLTADARLRDFVTSVSKRTTVLVDEAYHDFADDPSYRSMTDLVTRGENVIVSRTASKIHGLAGLRVGFAIARPDTIRRMGSLVTGAPNSFGMRAAIAAIGDTEYQAFVRARNAEGRAALTGALTRLGRRVAPSQTNFVFFHAGMPVERVQRAASERGFLVGRTFQPYRDWCRVSIGTPDEMSAFVKALPAILA